MSKRTSKAEMKRAIIAEVHGKVDRVMRAVTLDALGKIMRRTPVDTGRARANWNTTVGSPDTSVNEEASRSDVSKKARDGRSVIRAAKFAEGERVYIANGLPYIDALENGSSKQAPNGMVALTLAEVKPTIDDLSRQVEKEFVAREKGE